MKTKLYETATKHLENLRRNWSSYEKYYEFCKNPNTVNKIKEILVKYYEEKKVYTISTPDNIYSYPVYATNNWFNAKPLNNIELSFTSNTEFPEKPNPNIISNLIKSYIYETTSSQENLPKDVTSYLEDQRIYCFTEFAPNKNKFTVTETKAFKALSYSQKIYKEIFDKLYNRSNENPTLKESKEKCYRENHLKNPQQIVDMSIYPRQIIISTLVVFKDENGDLKTIVSCPEDQYMYSEWLMTVPTGRFQPTAVSEDESDFTHSVLKQFGQQLYSYNTFLKGQYKHKVLDNLTSLLIGDGASLYYTGAGINLIDGTPFITTLLYIKDEEFFNQYMSELLENQKLLKEIQLTEENISQMIQKAKIRPESVVSLYEGASYIDKNYQSIFSG